MNIFFETSKTIHFREADPAGIMFFANIYDFAHDAFEEFITHLGFEWKYWFANSEFIVPLRSSHAEYSAPLKAGKTYQIKLSIKHLGDSSFTAFYEFKDQDKIHATVELAHTFVNPAVMKKMSLPENIRQAFTPYCTQGGNHG